MANFYFDENTSKATARLLAELGHSVIEARSVLPSGSSDHLHLAMGTRLRRILVTGDFADFRLLQRAWRDWFTEWGTPPQPRHAGILIIKQPPILEADDAATMIHTFVTGLASVELLANRCHQLRPPRGWHEIE
ncbi:MAG: DUF5615 family PIN-like protein [Thermomicrobiales bacterium]